MTVVKICGVTTPEDALAAAQLGADMLGLNFYPPSPRYVDTARAREIAQAVRAEYPTILVGVFVNTDRRTIDRIMDEAGLDLAQLSGDEPPSQTAAVAGRAVKAIRPRSLAEATALAEAFLPHA
ncbi:MAG: N-(5'-phosphoribosyl)anthranilate isomerase, partial [Anaerolineae bacterium]